MRTVVTLFLCGLLALPIAACHGKDELERNVVLVVGASRIGVDELKRDLAYVNPGGDGETFKDRDLMEPALKKVIDRYLIMEYAREQGISVSEAELEDARGRIAGQYEQKAFQEVLLKEYVAEDQWKSRLREQLLIEKALERGLEAVPVPSYEEILARYAEKRSTFTSPEMIRFRQIVTRTREEAEALLAALKGGEDMAGLARLHSTGPERENGGEVGWVAREELEESMANALFSMPVGKIGPVVRSPYGYHIFEVLAVRRETRKELPEVYREIEAELTAESRGRYFERWLQELTEEFPIQIDHEKINKIWMR